MKQPESGRLLVFVGRGSGAKEIDTNPFSPSSVYVAARDVGGMNPGETVDVDVDEMIFPGPLSGADAGDYQAQAVLDVGRNYNYLGRAAGDLISPVVAMPSWNPQEGLGPDLTLDSVVPERTRSANDATKGALEPLDFKSAALSKFWGRDIRMRGWVLLPPSYKQNPQRKYPTVYYTHGFGGNAERIQREGSLLYRRMSEKKMPDMIWVLLDESSVTGTHEFADSVNNGPWGEALTRELIPYLESRYRMDARSRGRFLQGHSSGGWATLWLQVTYPKIFGGTWSTSPDPSDFHDFTGPDLYAPGANFYYKPDGTPWPIIRDKGKVVASTKEFARLEEVLGDPGGQFASFEWVFSPRGPDGRPMQMFDRVTGAIHPDVVAYWRDHYDIAHLVEANWKTLAPDLRGKIHVFVGTADTFYLDGPAHKLEKVLDNLHANAHFTYIPDRTHFDLYGVKEDRQGLIDQIAAEMYAVAKGKTVPVSVDRARK
jgi:enterochelin esterase-like enzyme